MKVRQKSALLYALIALFATGLGTVQPAFATTTNDVLVDRIDFSFDFSSTPATEQIYVHLLTASGAAINADAGCDVFWVEISPGSDALLSILLTAQSRKSKSFVDIVISSGTRCKLKRFVTME